MATALCLEFSGGSEFLVGNQKMHNVSVPGSPISVRDLIQWISKEMLKVIKCWKDSMSQKFTKGRAEAQMCFQSCSATFSLPVAGILHFQKDCDRTELLIENGTVRPGVLVLINESDWELHDQIDTVLHDGDTVTFISTLHGG